MDPDHRHDDDGSRAPPSIETVCGLVALAVFAPFTWYGWDAYRHSRMPIVDVRDERIVRARGSFLGIATPEQDYVEYRFTPSDGGESVTCRRSIRQYENRTDLPRAPHQAYDSTGGCNGIESVSAYGLDWRITSLKAACLGYLVLALGFAFIVMG